jgi:HAD superfamily hydrolase (TIGR01549 family)
MAITAIIFDMDGVLIDSEPLHTLAKERVFARFGITLPESVYDQYKGQPDATMMSEVVPLLEKINIDAGEHGSRAAGKREIDVEELLRLKRIEFEGLEHLAGGIPGAQEFVRWAKGQFRIAVATSATSRNRRALLSSIGLGESFDFIVDASGFTHPKPDPEVFQAAMRGLKADASECLVIEDSINGVRAGKAAGCVVVAITTTFAEDALRLSGADYVVRSFAEIRELLDASS